VLIEFAAALWVQKYGSSMPDQIVAGIFLLGSIPAIIAANRYGRFLKAGGKLRQQVQGHPFSSLLLAFCAGVVVLFVLIALKNRPQFRPGAGVPVANLAEQGAGGAQDAGSNVRSSAALPRVNLTPSPDRVNKPKNSKSGTNPCPNGYTVLENDVASKSSWDNAKTTGFYFDGPNPCVILKGTRSTDNDDGYVFSGTPKYEQKCEGSACAQGPGSQAIFNQYGSPLPRVSASAQKQIQTGKPEMPWATIFTISTNVLVKTGDLRIKCSGPVIMAGISRINPASLSTGSNGPNPQDPNEAIYQLGPEMLSPGQIVTIAVYSKEPVKVIAGSIGPNAISF
jgi:hypothetical protein